MKIFLRDQASQFPQLLQEFSGMPVMKYDRRLLKEKTTTIDITQATSFKDIYLSFFFSYKIFPPNIMSSLTQWHHEGRKMQVGDTIVQQVYIPPVRYFAQKIVFGVRISELINEPHRKGYSYETLEGHVEKGISTFTVEQVGSKTICSIQTFSEPGNLLTKILAPIFSIPYQSFCTRQALINIKRQIESGINPSG